MKTTDPTAFPADVRAELEQAVRQAVARQRDLEAARQACARMDRAREDLRKLHGEMGVAVDPIRQGRDEV